ncbi:hypothetical protein RchiOBHm_Chr4g0439271 [Rosa chinensis]|uniref:Uncharacterized protein n=1 Tax=Rosa chinensis TaxID=74649 RepID=A0A2P6R2U8_ROSCH|nr:hypothetical protein RchiOBHm_Chr4g0439271 [Rosa chinensis]
MQSQLSLNPSSSHQFKPVLTGSPMGFGRFTNPINAMNAPGVVGVAIELVLN